MPIRRVRGGYKIQNVATVHPTYESAQRQYTAIKASQAAKTPSKTPTKSPKKKGSRR